MRGKICIERLLHFRFWMLAIIVLCTLAWLIPLAKMGVEMDNRPERFAPEGDPAFSNLEEMSKDFGRDDYFVLLLKGDVWSTTFFEKNEILHKSLEALDSPPEQIWSLYNAPIYWEGEGKRQLLRIGKNSIHARLFKKGSAHLEERLVSSNGEWAAIWCQAPTMSQLESANYFRSLEQLARESTTEGFSIIVGGTPSFSASLDALTMQESNRLGGIAFGLMILFLAFWFRRFSMVVGPVLVMLLGIIWTYGAMAVCGVSLSYMTSVLPGFLISVCVGDAMHIQALIHQDLSRGIPKSTAIQNAVLHSWRPILWTTLTTAGGLLSFRMATLPAVAEMGTFGAIGVGMACVLSLLLIPISTSYLMEKAVDNSVNNSHQKLASQELGRFLSYSYTFSKSRHAKWILMIFAVLVGGGLWGGTKVKVEHEPLSWFPKDHPTRVAMDVLDTHFGGASELTIWVRSTDKQGVLATRHIQNMYKMEQKIVSYGLQQGQVNIQSGVGVLETLRLSYEAGDGKESFSEFVNNDGALTRFVMNLTLARPDWASDVVSQDQRSAKFVFRIPWRPAQDYLPLRRFLNKELALFSDRGLDMKPLGVLFTLLATFGVLVQELLVSFGVAAACISILMVIFLRSIRLGLISLIPNFVPVIMTLGGMALFDIPLDLGTVLFASIVLGICVDDTIHLLHHFQEEYKKHGSVDKAIHQALLYAGKPILITSLLLICCMGVYLFSELGSLQRFGGLMVMSVGWALLADLFLTPIILRRVYAERMDSTINLE